MIARPEDLTQLDRLIAVAEAACARLAARGADTAGATHVLARLHDAHATAAVWLGTVHQPAAPAAVSLDPTAALHAAA